MKIISKIYLLYHRVDTGYSINSINSIMCLIMFLQYSIKFAIHCAIHKFFIQTIPNDLTLYIVLNASYNNNHLKIMYQIEKLIKNINFEKTTSKIFDLIQSIYFLKDPLNA